MVPIRLCHYHNSSNTNHLLKCFLSIQNSHQMYSSDIHWWGERPWLPHFLQYCFYQRNKNAISTLQEYLSNNGEKCYFLHLFRGTCPPQPHTLIMLWFVNGRTIPTILMFFKSRPITIKDSSAMSTFCSSSSSYLLNVSREEYEPLRQILIDLLLGASIFILVEFCKFSCDFFLLINLTEIFTFLVIRLFIQI